MDGDGGCGISAEAFAVVWNVGTTCILSLAGPCAPAQEWGRRTGQSAESKNQAPVALEGEG